MCLSGLDEEPLKMAEKGGQWLETHIMSAGSIGVTTSNMLQFIELSQSDEVQRSQTGKPAIQKS